MVDRIAACALRVGSDQVGFVFPSEKDLEVQDHGFSRKECPGLQKPDLYDLMEYGILAERVETRGLSLPGKLEGKTHKLVLNRNKGFSKPFINSNDVSFHSLTRVGRELCELVAIETSVEHLEWLATVDRRGARSWDANVHRIETVVAMGHGFHL